MLWVSSPQHGAEFLRGIFWQADYFYVVQQGSFSVSKSDVEAKEGQSSLVVELPLKVGSLKRNCVCVFSFLVSRF